MKPRKPPIEADRQKDIFKTPLEEIIDMKHELVRLAAFIPWDEFDNEFGGLYQADKGRPATPTRLMVGLHYLKEAEKLSDEKTIRMWLQNPYWQYFCGMKYFEHRLPIDPSQMTRWRQKVGEAGIEKMLAGITGLKISFRQIISERVIGGFEIQVGDLRIDATVKGRLEALRAGLLGS